MLRVTEKREVYVVLALLLISAAIVMLQTFSLERSLVINGSGSVRAEARDDRPSGGASVSTIKQTKRGLEAACHLELANFEWPYCEVVLDLSRSEIDGVKQGVDLSRFDRVGLWLQQGDTRQPSIRFQLHNFNPIYSTPGERETYKYNVVEYYDEFSAYPLWIDMKRFHVPTWWLTRHNLALENVGVDVSNTVTMGFVTGSAITPGEYLLAIERIEFRGKIFESASVFMLLVGIWGLAAVIFLSQRFASARRDLMQAKEQKLVWEQKATRDPLTGAVNRVGAHKAFAKQMYSVNRDSDFSIIFIDIDHFKSINDTHGHGVGDEVLKQFVRVLRQRTRDSDTLVRWGGEEFMLICHSTALDPAVALAEKLRAVIQATQWPEEMEITASFGVAQMLDETVNDFVERADRALYSAKSNGRNCVVSAA